MSSHLLLGGAGRPVGTPARASATSTRAAITNQLQRRNRRPGAGSCPCSRSRLLVAARGGRRARRAVTPPDETLHDGAVGCDQEGLRAPGPRRRPRRCCFSGSIDDGPVAARSRRRPRRASSVSSSKGTLTRTASPAAAWASSKAASCGMLLVARDAPAGEEVHDAPNGRGSRRGRTCSPSSVVPADGGRELADQRALRDAARCSAPGWRARPRAGPRARRSRTRPRGRCGVGRPRRPRRWCHRRRPPGGPPGSSVVVISPPLLARAARSRSSSPGRRPPGARRCGRHRAETGSVGRRRRPGQAARTVPKAMTPPPIHSHRAIGWMITRSVTSPPPSSGRRVTVRYTSSRSPVFTDGVPMSDPKPGYWDSAGRRPGRRRSARAPWWRCGCAPPPHVGVAGR